MLILVLDDVATDPDPKAYERRTVHKQEPEMRFAGSKTDGDRG